jgi:hypothetical protein
MHRRALRAGLLSFRARMGLIKDYFLDATLGGVKVKVMAGETPANPATLATDPLLDVQTNQAS